MQIKVRLFATLRDGRGKEVILEAENFTVRQLLTQLAIHPDVVAILLINGRDGALDTPLSDGDTVSLFPPVGGG